MTGRDKAGECMSLNDAFIPPELSSVDLCVLDLFQRNRLERRAFSLAAIHRSIVASAETAFAEFDLPHTRYMYSPFLVDIDPPVQPGDCIAAVERLIETGCIARNLKRMRNERRRRLQRNRRLLLEVLRVAERTTGPLDQAAIIAAWEAAFRCGRGRYQFTQRGLRTLAAIRERHTSCLFSHIQTRSMNGDDAYHMRVVPGASESRFAVKFRGYEQVSATTLAERTVSKWPYLGTVVCGAGVLVIWKKVRESEG